MWSHYRANFCLAKLPLRDVQDVKFLEVGERLTANNTPGELSQILLKAVTPEPKPPKSRHSLMKSSNSIQLQKASLEPIVQLGRCCQTPSKNACPNPEGLVILVSGEARARKWSPPEIVFPFIVLSNLCTNCWANVKQVSCKWAPRPHHRVHPLLSLRMSVSFFDARTTRRNVLISSTGH